MLLASRVPWPRWELTSKLKCYLVSLVIRGLVKPSALAEVKIKARKVDLDFFKNLSFREDGATDNDAKGASHPRSLQGPP